MRAPPPRRHGYWGVLLALGLGAAPALGQGVERPAPSPTLPPPERGLIRPPGNVDPGLTRPAPVPDPGTTLVIPPPPGSLPSPGPDLAPIRPPGPALPR
ncbi:hypothetical protein [Roseomonas sp. 18066]|uniref:hypothetical protein n=1 Tax=Roseomonas sp. 18066 TaxID=2681412 RepID=UPI00135C87D5|nr:hypothetical protein [Roseomonas sp. 18066]